MKIPKKASYLHMPITQNVPIDILHEVTFWKKFKKWRKKLPEEKLIEDFYQILPKKCNKFFGYDKNIDVCCFISKNFIFNGASIPRFFMFFYLPNGILYLGSFIHDYIYKYGELPVFIENDKNLNIIKLTQKYADIIFYEINQEMNELNIFIKIPFLILRMFGFIIWNKHRKGKI